MSKKMKAIVENSTQRVVVWSHPVALEARKMLVRFTAGCVRGQDGNSCPCHLEAQMLRAEMLRLNLRTAEVGG